MARLQREAEVVASLNHPNVAIVHGLQDADGVKALVMELVEGEDLSQRIVPGAIPIEEALPFAKQIADPLEAAHEQGITHRDLKPANVKMRADGTVKVRDFGAFDPATSCSSRVPTPSPTTVRHNARQQRAQVLSMFLASVPKVRGPSSPNQAIFQHEIDEGDGLKNRCRFERKSWIPQVLTSRTLSICGEVAERLKAAVC